jgi:penicillin amidase
MPNDELKERCRRVLAQLDGEVTLDGLQEPVEVIRDRWGVPHIYAENQHDLFFAQGFIAAQDRLFQIDLWRRMAVGEIAEIEGSAGIEADRFARLVKYRGDLDEEWQSYSPDTQEIATSFTDGINAYIDHIGDRLPIEFEELNYRPQKWEPADCLGRMSGVVMSRNFQLEPQRAKLVAEVGIEKARMLAPADPPLDFEPPDGLDLDDITPTKILAGLNAATAARPFSRDDGSNNWVINGARSESGKPLLASDPHRAIEMPSLRYLVHLNAPGWNVIGSGEPALPGVACGHNQRIAWGFTIICTDQADLYVEETHPDDPTRYRVGDDWEPMEIIREQIEVRGDDQPVELELRYTRHGPVIYQDESRNRAYALRSVGAEPGGAAYLASLAVDRAKNWEEFRDSLKRWKMPSENMVYADVDGNIGWVAAAMTPVRENSDGLFPVPGADGKHEWQRFLGIDELPQLFNPPDHIATANHNILPDDYPHAIAYEWAPNYRYHRILERLQTPGKFTLDDMQSMQHDNISLAGRELAELADGFRCDEDELETCRQMFADWDGELSRDSRVGPLYAFWLEALLQECFSRHVPAELMPFVAGQRGIPVMLPAIREPTAQWFGDDPVPERDRILRETFEQAVAETKAALGPDISTWRWDRLHTVTFHHALSARDAERAATFNRGPIGQAGDGLCPNATRYETPFGQISGASYRHLFDLADWDRGLATSAPGQSGQPESQHYDDLLELWQRDAYFPLLYSREAVEEAAAHRLCLTPK